MPTTKTPKRQRRKHIAIGHDTLDAIATGDAVDVFKKKVRFIYQGLPTRPARYLLHAMRRPTVAEYMKGYRGIITRDKLPAIMCKHGLLIDMPIREGRRGTAFFITDKGLEVLKYWASKNRDFHAYFHAYRPYDVEDLIKITVVDRAIEGGS